jgi:hypothetical protein
MRFTMSNGMKALWMVLALLLVPSVHALGIAPARSTIDFSPNDVVTIQYRVYNSERQNFDARIELSDDLKEIAIANPEVISFTENDVLKPFTLTLAFKDKPPQSLDGRVTIVSAGNPQGQVSANVEISARINIETTGAVVSSDTVDMESKPYTRYILGALLLFLVMANTVYLFTKKKPTVVQPKPSAPAQENIDLDEAREIEEEIDRLRKMS